MLESYQYKQNTFVTLTYSDEHLPVKEGPWHPDNPIGSIGYSSLPTLIPKHLQDWFKRYRSAIHFAVKDDPLLLKNSFIRYYAVGEYGDVSWRPHFHAAIFNGPACFRGSTKLVLGTSRPDWARCCPSCRMVGETWGKGDVHVGRLETHSAQYLCGYVTKKMTKQTDARLFGRYPEFARMSLKPPGSGNKRQFGGIGASAMWELADKVMQFNLDELEGDVPVTLQHGKRKWPIGRYLAKTLRKMVGRDEKTPQHKLDQAAAELSPMWKTAFDNSIGLSAAISLEGEQARRNLASREKISRRTKS